MKITKAKINNYKSILDSEVDFTHGDNIAALIGQNESGKSSILEAIRDFYSGKFEPDSFPFIHVGESDYNQSVTCEFEMEGKEKKNTYIDSMIDDLNEAHAPYVAKIDSKIFDKFKTFSITYTQEGYEFDENLSKILETFINFENPDQGTGEGEAPVQETTDTAPADTAQDAPSEPSENVPETLSWDTIRHTVINTFVKKIIPEIIYFEGGECDMLPDNIALEDFSNETGLGWIAVERLEKCLQEVSGHEDFTFESLFQYRSIRRGDEVSNRVKEITADFKADFKQKIHGIENDNLSIKFNVESRPEGENPAHRNFIDFAVETKEGEALPVRMRSKGMIWFLSFWLALKSLKERKSIILIDEPDRNLHINAQADLYGIFKKIEKKFKHQIIYATHAPALVPLDLMYRIYLVINDKTKGTVAENILKSQIGSSKNKQEAISLVNYAIGCDVPHRNLVFKKKNVILEGTSDFLYFQAMLKILNRKNDYAIIPGVGTKGNKLNSLVSMCIGYSLKWCVILDGDFAGEGKYKEIKTSVFDEEESATRDKVMNLGKDKKIEDLFSLNDIQTIAKGNKNFQLGRKPANGASNISYIGHDRKNTFSKLFLERVESNEIKKDNLSKEVRADFTKIFDFIDRSFREIKK